MWVTSAAAGLLGWTLLASGGGKAGDWAAFRGGLQQGGIVPRALVPAVGAVVPPLELLAGAWVLIHPGPAALRVCGVLFLLFAMYQGEMLRHGPGAADCHCYGRLRQVRPGPGASLANAALAFSAFGASFGAWGTGSLAGRLLWGAVATALYLLAAGRSQPKQRIGGYPYAEVRYVERRLAGERDQAAREALARDLGVRPHITYLMIPRYRAWWLVLRARWRGSAASIL
jgi:hypothetical protein